MRAGKFAAIISKVSDHVALPVDARVTFEVSDGVGPYRSTSSARHGWRTTSCGSRSLRGWRVASLATAGSKSSVRHPHAAAKRPPSVAVSGAAYTGEQILRRQARNFVPIPIAYE